ncbi:MAG: DUF3179 domain-containing protein [Deltaproteobacteria bacterium]|nr:DUF3179 domain-containing protein [Deltaproteobacteria bacterium]MBW2308241.1 DUF3179 domain-containing protein [Deltaproteobacteria bacterium]
MKTPGSLILSAAALVLLTGFNLDNAIVPRDEILSGGPPKDGIPAILNPKFIQPGRADFLKPDERVIGVRAGSRAKAYPIKILNWHEVVNDTIDGVPVVVTF